jgi:hypothetical protein
MMNEATRKYAMSLALVLATACNAGDVSLGSWSTGGEEAGGEADDGGTSTGSADDTTDDGADETAEGGEGGGEGGGVPCGYPGMLGEYDLVQFPTIESEEDYRFFDPNPPPEGAGDCDFEGIFDQSGNDEMALTSANAFEVFVYHPQDGQGDWPVGLDERPVIFFGPGNGYNVVDSGGFHRYPDLVTAWVEMGFVVIGVQPESSIGMSSGQRRAAMACAMIWARDEYAQADRLGEFVVLSGHSRTGGSAYLLTEHILSGTNLPEATSLDGWRQCALVTLAQRYADSGTETFIDPITHADAPPFLSMLGTVDEDTINQGIAAFDGRHAESS